MGTFNASIIPSVTGLDLGTPVKRFDAYLKDVDISGSVTGISLAANQLTTAQQIVSTLAPGTAPFSVLSNTKVDNLNADKLDGFDWASPDNIGTGVRASGKFTSVDASGIIASTLATGTAPISVASSTKCPNLNADLLDGSDWSAPPAIGNVTPVPSIAATAATVTNNTLTNATVNNLTVAASVAADGGGLKHGEASTGSIAAGARAVVTVTWGTTFPDTNYRVVASVYEFLASGTAAGLRVEKISARQMASVKVQSINDAAGALSGTVFAIAMHL